MISATRGTKKSKPPWWSLELGALGKAPACFLVKPCHIILLRPLLRGHISARVLTRTWAEGEASDVQAPVAGISYVVFGSWDLGKPLSSPK